MLSKRKDSGLVPPTTTSLAKKPAIPKQDLKKKKTLKAVTVNEDNSEPSVTESKSPRLENLLQVSKVNPKAHTSQGKPILTLKELRNERKLKKLGDPEEPQLQIGMKKSSMTTTQAPNNQSKMHTTPVVLA